VTVIGVAGLSFVRGSQWKERADERGARITDLEDELEATEAELQALEDRVGALTEEVSVAQDQLFIAELDVDQARELAALAGAVARDLASCVDGTSELVRIVLGEGPDRPDRSGDHGEAPTPRVAGDGDRVTGLEVAVGEGDGGR